MECSLYLLGTELPVSSIDCADEKLYFDPRHAWICADPWVCRPRTLRSASRRKSIYSHVALLWKRKMPFGEGKTNQISAQFACAMKN